MGKKIDIKNLKCIHRHTIDSHPRCFAKGLIKYDFKDDREFERLTGVPWYQYPKYKIGYLDIETDGLKADFSTMLSWAIKEKGGAVTTGVITKEELFNGVYDKRLIKDCIDEMRKYAIICTYNGCVEPGHKVLMSDLSWKLVEDLVKGDKLLAFEEEVIDHKSRQLVESEVVHNTPIERDCYEITLESGEKIVATGDHPWLVQLGLSSSKTGYWVWRTTEELLRNMAFKRNTVRLTKMFNVWEKDTSYEGGYLAAFFDSEGSVSQSLRNDREREGYTLTVAATQHTGKNGGISNRVGEYLDLLGVSHRESYYDKNSPEQVSITISGKKSDRLEFLGRFGLSKKAKLDISKLGRAESKGHVGIVSIVPVGKRVVCGLGTTSKTYILDGYGSHNTRFDIPYLRTKALHYGLDFPGYGELYHFDLYYTVKSKLNLSRKSLDNACDYLGIEGKTPISKDVWRRAKYGDTDALNQVLEHNIPDIEILEKLHDKLEFTRKWIRSSI